MIDVNKDIVTIEEKDIYSNTVQEMLNKHYQKVLNEKQQEYDFIWRKSIDSRYDFNFIIEYVKDKEKITRYHLKAMDYAAEGFSYLDAKEYFNDWIEDFLEQENFPKRGDDENGN